MLAASDEESSAACERRRGNEWMDVERYLDLKFEHFDKLRAHLTSGPGGTSSDE